MLGQFSITVDLDIVRIVIDSFVSISSAQFLPIQMERKLCFSVISSLIEKPHNLLKLVKIKGRLDFLYSMC